MFIAIPKSLKLDAISDVSPRSSRIQSLVIPICSYRLLLLNTYFPTDPGSNFDENALLLMLSDIEKILQNNEYDDVVWTGDLNADFRRRTKFVGIVEDFILKWRVRKAWDSFHVDFTHVTEREGKTFTSVLDHFLWNEGFQQHVIDAGVVHTPENMSDHSPVYCKLRIPKSEKEERSSDVIKRSIPSWRKADEREKSSFASELEVRLEEIELPAHLNTCQKVKCSDVTHRLQADKVMHQALNKLEYTARSYTGRKGCQSQNYGLER